MVLEMTLITENERRVGPRSAISAQPCAGPEPSICRGLFRIPRLNSFPWILVRGIQLLGACGFLAAPLSALNPDRRPDSYTVHAWYTEQGLPSNKTRAVYQTRDSYLWVATSQGLARFDGHRFTVFNGSTNPELRGGGFFGLQETPDGTLWCGGDNGLFRWRDGHFDRFTTAQGLADNYVRALTLARDGALVICTRLGYSFLRDGQITTPGGIWKEITGVPRSYLEQADGTLLLGTEDGLWRIKDRNIERLSGTPAFPGGSFNGLAEGPDGSVWIGNSVGLRCIHPDGKIESYGPAEGLNNPRVSYLRFDRDGNLWIGSYGGLYRFSRGRLEEAPYPGQIGDAPIQQMREDREGGWWIAASIGLFHLKDNVSRNIGPIEGLTQTSVYSVLEASDGKWWIGLWGGGVYLYDQQRATPLPAPEGIDLDLVICLAEEPAGTVWIGGNGGLYRHSNDTTINLYDGDQAASWLKQLAEKPDTILPGLAHRHVNSITSDGQGALWVATDGALYHGGPGHFRAYTTADGLPGNTIKSVLRAANGDIWVTVPPVGVACLHDDHWTSYLCGKELSDIFPRAAYQAAAGDIWITTEGGGLNRWKNGQWRTFTTHNGLSDDFIAGMVEDGLGNFWIPCPRGIMRIPQAQFDEIDAGRRTTLEPRVFDRSDGLPAGEVNQIGWPTSWRTRDGRLMFATNHGVAVIEPNHLNHNQLVPPVQIERVLVNGNRVDASHPLVLPPIDNDLQIFYTTLSFLVPGNVRFKIRLSPLDHQWIDTGGRREIRYDRLPPGEYRFQVIGCNNDGVWNEQGAALTFVVQRAFYQTVWFNLLGIAAIFAAAFALYRIRLHRARRRLAELEALVQVRTRELQDAQAHLEKRVEERTAALEEAEHDAQQERARFKFIFDSVPVGVSWMLNTQVDTRIVNAEHARLTGVPIAQSRELQRYVQATHPNDRARQEELHQRLAAGQIDHYTLEKRYVHPDGTVCWVAITVRLFRDPANGMLQELSALVDITERKQAEAEREELHRQLLESSRQAGIAEVTTGVLHNVSNVLNSVNIATSCLAESLRKSKSANLTKVVAMLREHQANLGEFITMDPKGKQLPAYLAQLAELLVKDQASALNELSDLQRNVEHIKDLVTQQQSFARIAVVAESIPAVDIVEDALKMNASSLGRHDIHLVREYADVPPLVVEKNKVLQILINLVRNATQACDATMHPKKQLTVRISPAGDLVRIAVIDNGTGIAPENLPKIFSHGFTTKKDGHGFGLHSASLTAKQLGGSLLVQSEGPSQGATFILELPVKPPHRPVSV